MGLGSLDTIAFEAARKAGFKIHTCDTDDEQMEMIRVQFDATVDSQNAAKILANALDSSCRFFGTPCTVWLKIDTKEIPEFVAEAIEIKEGFGMGLIVTHGECCSHEPGGQLPTRVQKAVENISTVGRIWHPIANKPVSARP